MQVVPLDSKRFKFSQIKEHKGNWQNFKPKERDQN